ncbi:MAG: hypothetical protein INQ03_09100 [Candidatus Heimdallarchaeota archaeon]|nr:hypothetical protein [Candidatus Heimdallarchaeota archaeon]
MDLFKIILSSFLGILNGLLSWILPYFDYRYLEKNHKSLRYFVFEENEEKISRYYGKSSGKDDSKFAPINVMIILSVLLLSGGIISNFDRFNIYSTEMYLSPLLFFFAFLVFFPDLLRNPHNKKYYVIPSLIFLVWFMLEIFLQKVI